MCSHVFSCVLMCSHVSESKHGAVAVCSQYTKQFETHRKQPVRALGKQSPPDNLKTQEMTGVGTWFYLLVFAAYASSNIAHTAPSTKPTRHKRRLFAHFRPAFIYKKGVYMPPPPGPLPPNPPKVPPAGPFASQRTYGYDPTYHVVVG